jgi:hypothetical protein
MEICMPSNGAEYEPEGTSGVHKMLETLPFGLLLLSSGIWVIKGAGDPSPALLSAGVCAGGFATFMIARIWLGGAPVVES